VALIESSSPHQIDELPGFRSSYEEDLRDSQGAELWKDRLRVWTGWDRLTGHCSVSPSRTVQGEWVAQYAAMACRPGYVDTDEMELPYFEASSKEAAQLRTFGSIPLLVVSRDIRFGTEDDTAAERARQPVWEHEQESEKLLSPKSWRVVANKSGHMVPLDRPDVIINEVTRLVSYLRGGDAPRFGSTTDSQ